MGARVGTRGTVREGFLEEVILELRSEGEDGIREEEGCCRQGAASAKPGS